MKMNSLVLACLMLLTVEAHAQMSQQQRTKVQGNTEINVNAKNVTAIAAGEGNVAKNRIGVIKGEKQGDMRISVSAANVTTIASGRNKKACTNIGGVVSNECK